MATTNDQAGPVKEQESSLKTDCSSDESTEKKEAKGGYGGGESLEDLCSTLRQQIYSSDWLKVNTAEKWQKDNPELAKAYLEEANKS